MLGDSINSCKTCFDCKSIIEEEQCLIKIQNYLFDKFKSYQKNGKNYIVKQMNLPKLAEFRMAIIIKQIKFDFERFKKF